MGTRKQRSAFTFNQVPVIDAVTTQKGGIKGENKNTKNLFFWQLPLAVALQAFPVSYGGVSNSFGSKGGACAGYTRNCNQQVRSASDHTTFYSSVIQKAD